MKVFVVLLITLSTASLVFAYNTQRLSSANSNDYDTAYHQQWPDQRNHPQWQRNQQDSLDSTSHSGDSLAFDFIDYLPYRLKITQRLENSAALHDQAEAKENITKFFEDNLNVCRNLNFGPQKADRHCVGRLTGQVMQMIAMLERGGLPNWSVFNNS